VRLHITVTAVDHFHNVGAAIEVPDIYKEAFRPFKTTESPILSICLNEPMPNSEIARRVLTLRKQAAKELSEHIAEILLKEMAKADTLNGYALERV
jgi:hypothetical protein